MVSRLSSFAAVISLTAVAACDRSGPDTLTGTTVQMAIVAGADHGGRPYSTALTQEVTSTPVFAGDPDGSGTALITINLGQREVCWQLSVKDVRLPATASHIHRAAAGVRGPIVIGLTAPDADGHSQGCTTVSNKDLLQDLLHSPESFYVNVHTTEYPPGAVRGQLDR